MFNKLFVPLPSLNLNGILLIYFLVYFGIIIYKSIQATEVAPPLSCV